MLFLTPNKLKMAAGGNGSNAWRLEDLQELALADELQTGLHLSGINTEFTLVAILYTILSMP